MTTPDDGEEQLEATLRKLRKRLKKLQRRILAGEDRAYIVIREEDVRPIDEDDIWAGQMFWSREEMDEDNELT